MNNPLAQHTATRETGAAFLATKEGGFALLEPLTENAALWLRSHVDSEATWLGEVLTIELRYFPDIADAIIAAGFTFEREPFPN